MAKITEKKLRYNAVYGAMVAIQVQEHFAEGKGAPDFETMRHFVEEAYAVADLAEEVQPQEWEPPEED
jgi:hypothetical protein